MEQFNIMLDRTLRNSGSIKANISVTANISPIKVLRLKKQKELYQTYNKSINIKNKTYKKINIINKSIKKINIKYLTFS